MRARSPMLGVNPDRPIDLGAMSIIREVDTVAKKMNLPYFLVGAMARDVLLGHVLGLNSRRATRDVDFAFALVNWAQFRQIHDRLIANGCFAAVRAIAHRLLFSPSAQERRVD